jgi:PGF-pre-PGF domain-containing protein
MFKKILFGGIFIILLITISNESFAGYEGDVIRKNKQDIYTFKIVPYQPYILENPCRPLTSIKIQFKETAENMKVKISTKDLPTNPTDVDAPGLEYAYCYFNILFSKEGPGEEKPKEDIDYILTYEFNTKIEWLKKNNIDEDTITSFTFDHDKETWRDNPTEEFVATDDSIFYITSQEDNRPAFPIVITGKTSEEVPLHKTGISTWQYILIASIFAVLIYFLPDMSFKVLLRK